MRSVALLLVSRVFSYKSMKITETSGARDSLIIQFTLSVIHMIIIYRTTLSENTHTHTHAGTHIQTYTHRGNVSWMNTFTEMVYKRNKSIHPTKRKDTLDRQVTIPSQTPIRSLNLKPS